MPDARRAASDHRIAGAHTGSRAPAMATIRMPAPVRVIRRITLATAAQPAPPPTLNQLFLAFTRIGLTSFGGGLSGWLLRDFVQRRRWLTEESFMNALAIAQAFPGINVVNLAIWIGFQLRGGKGALLGALGIAVPPMFVAILLLVLFERLSSHAPLQIAMAGVAE